MQYRPVTDYAAAALLYGTVPLALPHLVAYAAYRLECAIRAAAGLGVIGAGGLGFQLALSFQDLRYDEVWTFLYALILLGGLADAWSSAVRSRMGHDGGDRLLRGSAVAVVLLVALAAWHVGPDLGGLAAGRAGDELRRLAGGLLPPDFGAVGLGGLAEAAGQTLAIATLAGVGAAVAGAALALLGTDPRRLTDADGGRRRGAGRRGGVRAGAAVAWRLALRLGLLVLRAVPPPVWALLCLFVLPARALVQAGAGRGGALLYGVLPMAASRLAAYGIYRWEVALRDTVVVGAVGAGGLGELLVQELHRFAHDEACATLLVLVALTLAVDLAGAALRHRLR